jgi:hypothetical protein
MTKKKITLSMCGIGLLFFAYGIYMNICFSSSEIYNRSWTKPWNFQEYKYAFCRYTTPENYKLLKYSYGSNNAREMIVLLNERGDSLIHISHLDEVPSIDINRIKFSEEPVSLTVLRVESLALSHFRVIYLWSLFTPFWQNQSEGLTVKGIHVQSSEILDTPEYKGVFAKGIFRRLGFFSKPKGFFHEYTTPALDFGVSSEGAIAIITSKASNKTFFVTGTSGPATSFDEKTFREFLKTISFKDTFRPKEPNGNYANHATYQTTPSVPSY